MASMRDFLRNSNRNRRWRVAPKRNPARTVGAGIRFELEMDNQAEHEERLRQVFESAGGYAPTIGIIGAVLGLIQVMQHLDNIEEVGRGIAVAFVATIYGVAAANIFFLPAGGKLKIKIREEQLVREMMLEGVISILEGMNPRMVETKLRGFLADSKNQ